jgi:transcriptional regulator with XRE-family HTH domain
MRDIVGAMAHRSVFPGFDGLAEQRQRVIGELVHERQRRGLSQTEIAARMRTSQSAVARLESGGGDVRFSTLQRYAAAVGGDLEWGLVRGQEEAP